MTEPAHDEPSATADEDVLAALADDFAARLRRGERATVEEYAAKHPELGDRIRKAFPAIAMIEESRTTEPAAAAGERVGSTIGRYKLLERIGEGGFGVVYMAEQLTPVRRKVALKLIKPGMDSRQVLARFEAERQALALMEHENIAKVLDAGATDAGRPYFVMELVRGVPITEFCDQHQLTPRRRLELFANVCQAVQHAHQKGIIHRDIKPTNVLVMMHDTTPVVKVIDFGVAKALGQELTEKTLFTGFAQLIGTPLYMSPEQAGQSALDVDTRSDIYSLGVLLYELLTGTTPFDKERFRKAAQDEIRRIIREEEPPKPSTRLSESKDSLASISARRHTEPAKLTRLVRGELDWIVMKALEKDRARRYESASSVAADVQRYLADEPVRAGPPRAGYRLRKFVKRNRRLVLAATAVLLALVVGFVGTAVGLVEARRQRDLTEQARKDEAGQRLRAVANAGKAEAARGDAERLAKEEKAARDRAEWLLFTSQITLAQFAWEGNNAIRAFHHLGSSRPDFRGWEYDYLLALFTRNELTLRADCEVTSVALSADAKRVVSGGGDGTVRVWDVDAAQNTGAPRGKPLPASRGPVFSVALSADGKRVFSGNWDRIGVAMTAWDADTGQRLWAVKDRLGGGFISVALSPDGNRVISGGFDGAVQIWDAATGAPVRSLRRGDASGQPNVQGQSKAVNGLAFSPDGRHVVGCEHLGGITMWDAATGKETRTFKGHGEGASNVVISADGRHVVSGGLDHAVKVWDAATGLELQTLKGHALGVRGVALSPDGKRVVSGSTDGLLKVWDVDTGQEIRTFKGHTDEVSSVALSADGKRIVSGSKDQTVKLWDADAIQEPPTLKGHTSWIVCAATSGDGRRVASADAGGTIRVWDSATGQNTVTLNGHPGDPPGATPGVVTSVAMSRDGKRVVSAGWDKTVKVWDAATGQNLRVLKGHGREVMCAALNPDDVRIVGVGVDGTVIAWDAGGGREKTQTLQGYVTRQGMSYVHSVSLSPDARHVVGGSNDGTVRVWDVATGENTLTFKGHRNIVTSVAMSRDGKLLVSGSGDNTVKVWDTATGEEALTLKGHARRVNGVALSPDARRVFSGSLDGTVKVWDAARGHETLTLGHSGGVSTLAMSADGRCVISGSHDHTVTIWRAGDE